MSVGIIVVFKLMLVIFEIRVMYHIITCKSYSCGWFGGGSVGELSVVREELETEKAEIRNMKKFYLEKVRGVNMRNINSKEIN